MAGRRYSGKRENGKSEKQKNNNANEACPFFSGAGSRLHKGFEDPANVEGTEEEKLR